MTTHDLPIPRKAPWEPGTGGISLCVLLLIVAGIAVLGPAVAHADSVSKEAALMSNLATMRQAVEMYREQHGGAHPARPAIQLVYPTDVLGRLDGEFGPYLRNGIPTNPITLTDAVRLVEVMPDLPALEGGWVYCTTTGEFRADHPGRGPTGTSYWHH